MNESNTVEHIKWHIENETLPHLSSQDVATLYTKLLALRSSLEKQTETVIYLQDTLRDHLLSREDLNTIHPYLGDLVG